MSRELLNNHDRDSGREHEGARSVAQVMQTDTGELCLSDEILETISELIRVPSVVITPTLFGESADRSNIGRDSLMDLKYQVFRSLTFDGRCLK